MIYVVIEDFGYDGSTNKFASSNLVQVYDFVMTLKPVIKEAFYDICVERFDSTGKTIGYVYLREKDIKDFQTFKQTVNKESK